MRVAERRCNVEGCMVQGLKVVIRSNSRAKGKPLTYGLTLGHERKIVRSR